jgi:beta-galactosidase
MNYGPSNGFLDGQPAALTRVVGNGRMTYVGALLDEKLMKGLANWLHEVNRLEPAFGPLPAGVEACRRIGQDHEVVVLINHSREAKRTALRHTMRDTLRGKAGLQEVTLPPQGVAVLERAVP